MKCNSLVVITMLLFFKASLGQDLVGDQLNRPRVEFLSPQTYDFVKYGNLPVSHFNGEADVKIPVYTYSDRDFNLPIFLGYNGSGFMPSKRESIVGLSWYLNSGAGVITRKVNNRPDEKEGFPLQPSPELHGYYYGIKNNLINNKTKSELFDPQNGNLINDGWWTVNNCELEPDDFTFSIPGYSGKFFIENNGTVRTSGNRPFKVDLSGFAIQLQTSGLNLPASTISVTTDDGYKYTFGGALQYLEVTYGMAENNDVGSAAAGFPVIDAWHLKEIQAPNGRTVTYEYEPFTEGLIFTGYPEDDTHYLLNIYDVIYQSELFQTVAILDAGWRYHHRSMSSNWQSKKIRNLTKTVYLKKISISNSTPEEAHTTIEFANAEKQKAFYRLETTEDMKFSQKTLQLNSIYVKHHGTTIKQFDLAYDYFGGTYDRQFLTSLKELGSGSNGYNFYYHKVDPRISSTLIDLPNPRTHAIDHWGFWNAGAEDQSLLPEIDPVEEPDGTRMGDMTIVSSERNPDVTKCDVALLAKITYPTGGHTEFSYEPHAYARRLERRNAHNFIPNLYNVTGNAGGARIKKIVDNDGESNVNEREFLYVEGYPEGGTVSSGILLSWPRYAVYWRYAFQGPPTSVDQTIFRLRSTNFNTNYYPGENFIHYSEVTELHKPANGFIHYKFNSYKSHPNSSDIDFDVVLPSTQQYTTNVHSYNNYAGIKLNDRSSERGLPYDITTYALKDGGGHYKVKNTTTYFSEPVDYPGDYIVGVHQTGGLAQSYKLLYHPVVPTSIRETFYAEQETKSSISYTTNTYNSAGYLLTNEIILSDGTKQKTKYKYPLDLVENTDLPLLHNGTATTALYQSLTPEMKAIAGLRYNNIVKTPIEIINYRDEGAVEATFVEYQDFGSSGLSKKVYPSKIWAVKSPASIPTFLEAKITKGSSSWSFSKNAAYNLTPEATFDHYDAFGNLLQTTDKTLLKKSYRWGYDNLYPVAEATGVSHNQFFYTGFEDAEGTEGVAKAGRKSRPGGYSRSLSGLTPGTYILSYWQKQADDTWQPVRTEVNVSTNPHQISIPSSIHLDELRFYPKSSPLRLMTYTYDPLIGITSKADFNDKFEYYTFDTGERLRLIKDFSGSIIKRFEYQYKAK